MPVLILSGEEREAWAAFPEAIEDSALGAFFTLAERDLRRIRRLHGDENRLAVALGACSLRWLGFIPEDLTAAPEPAVGYLAEQLDAPADCLAEDRRAPRTRGKHARLAERVARFRIATPDDLGRLHGQLLSGALEHDSPLALLREACRWLRAEQLVRAGITTIERIVSTARMDAERVTHRTLGPGARPRVGAGARGAADP